VLAEIQRAAPVRQPTHDELVATDDLLSVDAEVLPLLVRPARDDQPPCDKRCRIAGPARLYGNAREVDVIPFPHNLLARRRRHLARRHVPHGLGHCPQLAGFTQAARRFGLFQRREESAHVTQFIERLRAHAQRHAARGAEQVCQYRHVVLLCAVHRLLKDYRRTFGAQQTVTDFGHFQAWRHRPAHAAQFARALKLGEEVT
jgi:hypothetical protein